MTRSIRGLRQLPKGGLTLALAALIAVISVTAMLATTSAGAGRRPAGAVAIGVADPGLIGEPAGVQASQVARMKSIGITAVRLDANWRQVQPDNPGEYHWARLDQAVSSLRLAGMSVDLIIDGCPGWAAVPGHAADQFAQPASPAAYASWARDVAARYAPRGVRYFEIWNEPNIARFWQPRPDPVAYAADLRAAYRSIKAVSPSALVISGGLAPAASDGTSYSPIDFLDAMYKNGAKGSFDALGYHPYSFPVLPNTYERGSAWTQMNETRPSIRSTMTANGDAAKQVWITEFGAPSAGRPGMSPAAQAEQITQALSLVMRAGWIGGFYIYTWQDSDAVPAEDDGFGLVSADGQGKASFFAVAAALRGGAAAYRDGRQPVP